MPKPNPPEYIPGQQGGLSKAEKRYRLADGTLISKKLFFSQSDPDAPNPDAFGFFSPVAFIRRPETELRGKIERLMGGAEKGLDLTRDPILRQAAENLNHLIGFVEPDTAPLPIPSHVRAAYNLADYYCNTEGDVEQHVTAPIEIGLNTLTVAGPLKKQVEELYAVDGLNMNRTLAEIFYSTIKYGAAYPYEVYDGNRPQKIVLLPPKFMWVGYQVARAAYTETIGRGFQIDTPYRLRPLDGSPLWNQALLDSQVKPIAYAPSDGNWNEQVPEGEMWGMKLPLEFLWPVRGRAMPYERYAMPSISRAFHSIGSRTVFREMRRATIEGYRNQLWLFILGEKDKPPSPAEMAALRATLSAMAGERTGYLAWRFGLEAKVIAPNAMDNLLTGETAMLFTLEIFRDLGVSMHLSTGNPASIAAGRGSGDLEVDLSLWLRRLEAARRELLEWEYLFRLRWALREGGENMVKEMRKTHVQFSKNLLEVGDLIKKELQPMYMTGAISVRTFLERAGYDYDIEKKNKQAELPDRELNMPMPTYNQTTENGAETKTAPQGRPANSTKVKANILASWEDDFLKSQYVADVTALLDEHLGGTMDVGAFIIRLAEINENTLRAITDESYRSAGGVFELKDTELNIAANFVNSFARGFGQALLEGGMTDDEIRRRAMLYPQEGYKMAMLNGQAFAMRDFGATAWRRITHDGACADCVADSQLLHAITEPFVVMHPNERCFDQNLHVRYFSGNDMLLEVPIPGAPSVLSETVQGRTRSRRTRA